MPLYEYRCSSCGDVFEVMQKFSDAPLAVHDKCGGAVERLLSAPALQFKGSGWYITDYARAGTNGNDKPKADKPSESTKADTAKSDTAKPEAAKSSSEASASSTSKASSEK